MKNIALLTLLLGMTGSVTILNAEILQRRSYISAPHSNPTSNSNGFSRASGSSPVFVNHVYNHGGCDSGGSYDYDRGHSRTTQIIKYAAAVGIPVTILGLYAINKLATPESLKSLVFYKLGSDFISKYGGGLLEKSATVIANWGGYIGSAGLAVLMAYFGSGAGSSATVSKVPWGALAG